MSSTRFISVASVQIYTRLFGLQTVRWELNDFDALCVAPKIFERVELALGS
jgi:hypothetical protein